MLDWLLNPSGVPYVAYVVLWIALLVILPVAFVVGLLRAIWAWREGRDGVKPKRVHR
jgi:membrane-anchored protein YejM (alkaline phosphatase superfamily)